MQDEINEILLKEDTGWVIFFRQLKNPLLIILVSATIIAFLFGEKFNAAVIGFMIGLSVFLGFWNEFAAEKTVKDLLKRITFMATVIRGGEKISIAVKDIRRGDEVFLYPGAVIPADLKLVEAENLQINESALTGESLPAVKDLKNNLVFMGTSVTGGSGKGMVVEIGRKTKFGQISQSSTTAKPETQFQKGLMDFSNLLVKAITIMGILILGINLVLGRPMLQAVLFALTVAIGLTPELLPVVVTVSLAHGAKRLAKKDVVVKQLVAIEDLGNMEVLCSDKTGTLTEGKLQVISHPNTHRSEDDEVLKLALWCNTAVVHHKIFGDAIDTAIWEHARTQKINLAKDVKKIADEPFDFENRGMWAVIEENQKRKYIFKGAPEKVLELTKKTASHKLAKQDIDKWFEEGYRVVGVAYKDVETKDTYSFKEAHDLTLAGFVVFSDPPKHKAREALDRFEAMGVKLKIITGDNEIITERVCKEIDVPCNKILTGPEVAKMDEAELIEEVWKTDVFARMTPEAKLRVIKALKVGGHTVGYMGDGVNDAPALHEADAGISVDTAVDIAKDTANIVLLKKSLWAIADGIAEGRRTFANTRKYILMGTSSNFGNMFSMVGASFLLPFLPMSPTQILLANAMYDVSQLTIPTDNVDKADMDKPSSWNVAQIKKSMLVFGPISSIFDFATFGIMYFWFAARDSVFQTGWFVESLATQILVIYVIRTKIVPFWKSRPSKYVVIPTLGIVGLAMILPFTVLGPIFSLAKLPMTFFLILIVMLVTYLGMVELTKKKAGI